jgi:hypothetical protein
MIEHLAVLIETFPGAPNQTRCFAHILNLVAKSVLRQFEAPKKGKAVDGKELATDVDEIEGDNNGASDGASDDDVDDEIVDDDDDGLPDELKELSEEELLSVKTSVKPVQLVLTKVSQLIQQTSINKSTT